jgi:hypothetical protein
VTQNGNAQAKARLHADKGLLSPAPQNGRNGNKGRIAIAP